MMPLRVEAPIVERAADDAADSARESNVKPIVEAKTAFEKLFKAFSKSLFAKNP